MRSQSLSATIGVADDHIVAHLVPQFVEILFDGILGERVADGQHTQRGQLLGKA